MPKGASCHPVLLWHTFGAPAAAEATALQLAAAHPHASPCASSNPRPSLATLALHHTPRATLALPQPPLRFLNHRFLGHPRASPLTSCHPRPSLATLALPEPQLPWAPPRFTTSLVPPSPIPSHPCAS
eukprot:335539-Pelagomonas_calceolata.AAC.1